MRLAFFATLFIPLALIAQADYHYVSHTGSDEYPYTSWETAADSIQSAIDASSPHDTVFIAAGRWEESVALGEYDSLAVIGAGWDSTFLFTSEYHVGALFIGDCCYVEGINLRGTWAGLDSHRGDISINSCKFVACGIGAAMRGLNGLITNCVIDSCGIGIYSYSAGVHVKNNFITNTTGTWAITLESATMLVENNVIISRVGSGSVGVDCIWWYHSVVRNNIIIGGAIGLIAGDQMLNNLVKDLVIPGYAYGIIASEMDTAANNIIIGCWAGIVPSDTLLSFINYNCLWGNETDIQSYGLPFDSIGNVFAYPMLVDPDSNDFRLQADSPLIDAGDPSILDVDSTRSDIGCYGGPGGCSYVYLDLAPRIPDSLSASVDSSGIHLRWRNNYEADFSAYSVNRDTLPGFVPAPENLRVQPDTAYYLDTDISPGHNYYYRISAFDRQGNVSDYSEELAVIINAIEDGDGRLPQYSVITSAYPNPFNSNVTIVYSASNLGPQPPEIRLVLYDIQGRVIKTLVNERKPMGTYRAVWDGTDDAGKAVSSGTYIARLYQWDCPGGDYPVKITLVK